MRRLFFKPRLKDEEDEDEDKEEDDDKGEDDEDERVRSHLSGKVRSTKADSRMYFDPPPLLAI